DRQAGHGPGGARVGRRPCLVQVAQPGFVEKPPAWRRGGGGPCRLRAPEGAAGTGPGGHPDRPSGCAEPGPLDSLAEAAVGARRHGRRRLGSRRLGSDREALRLIVLSPSGVGSPRRNAAAGWSRASDAAKIVARCAAAVNGKTPFAGPTGRATLLVL